MTDFAAGIVQVAQWVWAVLVPHSASTKQPFLSFAVDSLRYVALSYLWFILVGLGICLFVLRRQGGPSTLIGALRHLLPESIYTHRSFRVDLAWLPFSWMLNFAVFAALTLGAGAMQAWLVREVGHAPWQVPAGGFAILLQVVFTLLGMDLARFAWHYQGHKVPFFWEFHKGHHSPEVLHPVFIRTHPVDMFIRLTYMQVGGGLVGGGMMWMAGVDATAAGAGVMAFIAAALHVLQGFEHSHVPISFGRRLDLIFYPPHFHPYHHGALPQHRDVNFGITGGLTLWDKLAGTLYVPTPGEPLVLGASMEELGDANPHRTLRGFITEPFRAAARTLRRPAPQAATPGAGAHVA
jgi:sterol desaturase/sphingolipid hydroxylase (fatty acid hydroxylase superfamily)